MQSCGKNNLEKRGIKMKVKKYILFKDQLQIIDNNEELTQTEINKHSDKSDQQIIVTIGSHKITLYDNYCLYNEGKKNYYIEYNNITNIEHVYFSPDARWGLGIGLPYHVIVLNNGILKIQCKNIDVANKIVDLLSLKCLNIKVDKNILNVDLSWDNYFEKYHSNES